MSSFQQLRRSTTDRKASGLCGGVARQWGIDPLLVRVLAVLLAVSGGIGVVLYLAGWLLIPEEGHSEPLSTRWVPQSRSWPREVWIVAVVVACIACVTVLGSIAPVGLAPALIIVAVWYFGFRHRGPSAGRDETPAPPPARPHDPLAGPPTPFTQAARQWQTRVAEHQARTQGHPAEPAASDRPQPDHVPAPTETEPEPAPTETEPAPTETDKATAETEHAPTEAPGHTTPLPAQSRTAAAGARRGGTASREVRVPVPPAESDPFFRVADPVGLYTEPVPAATATTRKRRAGATPVARRLRWGVLLVAALAVAALAIVDAVGVAVPWVLYPATALLIIGLGLVIATWAGRARGLLALGVLLLIATPLTQLGAQAADRIPSEWGTATVSYDTQRELPATTSYPGGDYTVDLSDLTVTKPQTYTVHVQMGALRILLPRDVRVVVHASASAGAVQLPDREAGGKVAELEGVYGSAGPDAPTLTINASVDLGSVEVVR